ncbi:MAG: cytochrome d ubiquinol oxidase subunit II [Thermoleophilia bacterium]
MSLADSAAVLLVVGLLAYAVLGGADFGVGIWDATAGRGESGSRMRALIERSMGAVWETNHVWLIFTLVVFWTCFPVAFGSFTSTLFIPLFLAAVGIIFRGSTFALRGVPSGPGTGTVLTAVFAASSVLTPFFLGTLIGAVASGRVPVGNAAGDQLTSWWNPTSVLTGLLAIATGAYLAAVYLAADASRGGFADLAEALRVRALVAGVAAGAVAIGGLAVVRDDARPLYDGLMDEGLALVAASAVAGVATLILVWNRRYGLARVAATAAVAAVVLGWVVAQAPELLPGAVTVEEAAAPSATLAAVLIGGGLGMLILIPSLWYLLLLRFRGSLDKDTPVLSAGRDRA